MRRKMCAENNDRKSLGSGSGYHDLQQSKVMLTLPRLAQCHQLFHRQAVTQTTADEEG